MVDESDELCDTPQRGVKGNLVEILYHYIVIVAGQVPAVVALRQERISVSRADAMHVNAIEVDAPRHIRPGTAQKINAVAKGHDTTENLLKMKLGSARLRIGDILPVEDEYAH